MRRLVRHVLVLAAITVVSACGGSGPGVATQGPPVATAPGATDVLPALTQTPSGGGLDVGGILGNVPSIPADTTWIRVSDPNAPFTFEVPSTWTSHKAGTWDESNQTIGTVLAAGPDINKLGSDFSVPGVVIGIAANAAGRTPHGVVEADTSGAGACTPGVVQDAAQQGGAAAYRISTCGTSGGLILVMAIASSTDPGIIEILLQGTSQADVGYLQHIIGSLAASSPSATAAPAASSATGAGATFTITMNICQNQHGQGVAEGLITNTDSRIHVYRIVVAFSDPNGVFLNDTGWTTSALDPGVTSRWQAEVPSGLPAVPVSCRITAVKLIS
jgi:hypothetical protein